MKLTKQTKILIIGLGVMGGSYAKALSDKGYSVKCITKEKADIRYGMEHGMICYGTTEVEPELVAEAELIVFALYPKTFIDWIKKHQHLLARQLKKSLRSLQQKFLQTLWKNILRKERISNSPLFIKLPQRISIAPLAERSFL